MYRLLFSLLLVRLPAETVHRITLWALRRLQAVPGAVPLLRRLLAPRDPALTVRALGLEFPGPLGLAAGFDKDAQVYRALGAFGFGHVEVGTVTGRGQPGNPAPRLFRLPEDRAVINRMGFNNDGSQAAADRLRDRRRDTIVGVNIGKTKAVPEERAVEDYVTSARRLAPHADYLVVNVSSPNTPGLRDLQAIERLRPLLQAVRRAADEAAGGRRVPLLVKIAPDLADPDIDAVAELALELGLDGIIATNTTIARRGLRSAPELVAQAGGLSGAPLKERSLQVLRRLRERVGDRLVLISVGGVETADDVWERLRAGATLVQAYTGMIYGGPLWAYRIHRDLSRRLRGSAFRTLQDAIGPKDA
ncbi:quinone-dependent dihydroorotate dehydrogenase [Thermomonospora curvata]|uniref:Dihydroorotate dehydrogenase (quinone) n=1 Tax=Thermomonospora curvata (strain ATCC 19995 / DSM 43183 / JCM 3096 / KCTC 9072 / NBRC 15933 / NCIMB 10081 / Henssen B9) TaxID=471852 RepID=D1A1H0_THECD|nr:quinone-dependent dihydroorotate dehydrogenase [Thermomonospora curvata]ACY95892.1 dihydroorotate dehydrogenase [Thermomonospora curvata DSM 43183]